MSDTRQDNVASDAIQRPFSKSTRKPSEQGQTFRIGNKIVRIDAASFETPVHSHIGLADDYAETVISTTTHELDSAVGTLQMGLGNVDENNAALQDAARAMAGKGIATARTLNITPAWEVDYFRWPRLSRRLLKTHQSLFDQIGSQLLNDLEPTRSRIGVCSTFPREGKTTIATCLARWAALTGKRTLLIDADIERPKMTMMCGLDCTFGWQSILDSSIPASEAMIRSVESGLVFMPSRSEAAPMIVQKSVDRLSTITFQMKYEFDVVVIDMGTIDNICAHGTENMDVVDAMLVTRDPSRTSVGQMMDTRRVLNNLGMPKTYVAQNFARRNVA